MELNDIQPLFGHWPNSGSGSGSGYGYGYGSGSGSGSGSGYGDGSGYGYGYGSGSGDGSGDGSGSGSGSGYGDGSGSGDGSGYGYGYGSGSGSGSGSGYGDGSGDGSGDGYGDGSGSQTYWLACLDGFASQWTETQRARLQTLRDQGTTIAYWCSDRAGKPCNGGHGKAVSPGHIDEEKGPLNLCARGTLHATHIPPKWSGDRWWIVALHGEVVGDAEKFGTLKREIIGEAILTR